MPMVTRPSEISATARASRITAWKAAVSWMSWSAGSTIITASGLRAAIRPMPSATAGAVSRLAGSAKILSGGQHGGGIAHGIELLGVGEDEDVFEWDEAVEAADGLFEQGAGAEQIEQLFGAGVAAQRPEAGAGTTGKNQGKGVFRCGHDKRDILPFFRIGKAGSGKIFFSGVVVRPVCR